MRLFRLIVVFSLFAAPAWAQVPQGVQLTVGYQSIPRPSMAVQTFTAEPGQEEAARAMQEIVRRDLDYSDRFEMVVLPPSLDEGPVNYQALLDLGIDFLVTGAVEAWEDGSLLRLTLHDVVYSRVSQIRAFAVPPTRDEGFRMAVHATSDEVVFWATGQPGHAASRIAFRRESSEGGWEIMVVDSDGENLRRLVHTPDHILRSVAWHPGGERLAYSVQDREWGVMQIYERDLKTGAVRQLVARPGLNTTPAYSPDGRRLAFALSRDNTLAELYDMDAERRCCIRQLTRAPANMTDMFPSYSPDGSQIVYMSDRLGRGHIYVMPADGGQPTPITRFIPGVRVSYLSPKWSPTSSRIAFWTDGDFGFQIMLADATRPGAPIQQITNEGRSEDPTWAPNGRHLAFSGVRGGQQGIYVIDTVTRRLRPLVVGGAYELPAWSPTLKRGSDLAIGGF